MNVVEWVRPEKCHPGCTLPTSFPEPVKNSGRRICPAIRRSLIWPETQNTQRLLQRWPSCISTSFRSTTIPVRRVLEGLASAIAVGTLIDSHSRWRVEASKAELGSNRHYEVCVCSRRNEQAVGRARQASGRFPGHHRNESEIFGSQQRATVLRRPCVGINLLEVSTTYPGRNRKEIAWRNCPGTPLGRSRSHPLRVRPSLPAQVLFAAPMSPPARPASKPQRESTVGSVPSRSADPSRLGTDLTSRPAQGRNAQVCLQPDAREIRSSRPVKLYPHPSRERGIR